MTDLQDSSNIMMKATMKVANDYLKKFKSDNEKIWDSLLINKSTVHSANKTGK